MSREPIVQSAHVRRRSRLDHALAPRPPSRRPRGGAAALGAVLRPSRPPGAARLKLSHRASAAADEEDAALSAFNSFCLGLDRGRYPDLSDRDDLWRLLVVITARKLLAQTRRDRRRKRGEGLVVTETDLPPIGSREESHLLDRVIGSEPTPEFAAILTEDYQRLIDGLGDDGLRQVAVWRMEGYANDEIASRLGLRGEPSLVVWPSSVPPGSPPRCKSGGNGRTSRDRRPDDSHVAEPSLPRAMHRLSRQKGRLNVNRRTQERSGSRSREALVSTQREAAFLSPSPAGRGWPQAG